MGSVMPYRNRAYDIYRKNFSEASAVGFLSAILFTVFCEPVKNVVDFGEKWMELSGLPYQMNIALLGFVVGYGTVRMLLLMRIQIFRMLLNYQDWIFNPKSTTTKMWALMLGLLRGNGQYTCFYFEPLLPRLPVPDLNNTLDRFLLSMKCLLPDEEYIQLLISTESFRQKEGPQLHKYLLQRRETKRNWLSELWVKFAYLRSREPTAVNVNCYALDRKTSPTSNQLARAANAVYHVVKFYMALQEEAVTPQYMNDLIPVAMDGFRHMYSTTRIPLKGMDEVRVWKDQKHIIVFRKGVYFKLDVFKIDSDGVEVQITIPELYAQLLHIVELAEDSKDYCPVGVFSGINRDKWTEIHEKLCATETNRASLECLNSSLAFFVLEEDSAKNLTEEATMTMTGNGTNRFFDKCLQYIVYSNGRLGINAEHSSSDATIPGRIWEYCLAKERYTDDGGVAKIPDRQLSKLTPPVKLEWEMDSFESDVQEALTSYKKLADNFDLNIFLTDYGKGWIKTKRLSPDGFIQMAIQLAYYRTYQKCVKTYESASTRMFAEARTETIRPVTESSVQWVKAMTSIPTTRDQQILLLKKAISAQTKLKNEAVLGQGWDRHLFGLYVVSKELGMEPALFQNKYVWMPDQLSTSQTPPKFTHLWALEHSSLGGGFSNHHPDGYGVSYIIVGEDLLVIHVTSHRYSSETSSEKFGIAILDALADMRKLLD